MAQQQKKTSISQIRLTADIVLFVAFVLANVPQTTGIPLHEWISILFIVPIMVHILLDWKWIVSVTQRLFKRLPGEVRFNQIWDLIIFIMMVFVLFTGFIISEAALPALGIPITIDPFWSAMHDLSVNLLMVFVGVHLAVHWGWIVSMFKRYILRQPAVSKSVAIRGGK
jgi:cytochrome b